MCVAAGGVRLEVGVGRFEDRAEAGHERVVHRAGDGGTVSARNVASIADVTGRGIAMNPAAARSAANSPVAADHPMLSFTIGSWNVDIGVCAQAMATACGHARPPSAPRNFVQLPPRHREPQPFPCSGSRRVRGAATGDARREARSRSPPLGRSGTRSDLPRNRGSRRAAMTRSQMRDEWRHRGSGRRRSRAHSR